MARHVSGIVFDMGDVLCDATEWRRWLVAMLRQRGVAVDYDSLVVRWDAMLVDVYRGHADYWTRFRDLMSTFGFDATAVAELSGLAREEAERVVGRRSPLPGVVGVLSELQRAGLRLAVLTDSEHPAARVGLTLETLGIKQFFSAVVSSRDLGATKPDPATYRAAATALSLPIEACAFVGHDEEELRGAEAAGMCPVAVQATQGGEAVSAASRLTLHAFRDLTSVGA
jgi:HAD superfamily hydrolase (TIGR01509 family)